MRRMVGRGVRVMSVVGAGALGVAGGVVVPLAAAPPVAAAELTVDTPDDLADATPGDGICGDGSAGSCSLRAAVDEANAVPGADTITVPAGTYVLGLAGADEDANVSGDLDVTDSLTIVASGATLDAAALDRGVDVVAGTVTISGLTITGGNVPSGLARPGYGGALAVNAGAVAHLDGVSATGNQAAELGGAFGARNGAQLDVVGGVLSGNTAPFGGAIGATFAASVAVSGSTVSTNVATKSGGGVFTIGPTTVTGATVSGNSAGTGWGGGVSTILVGPLTVIDSAVADNSAAIAGGTLSLAADTTLLRTSVTGNTAGLAGGVGNAHSELDIETSTVSSNTADIGSGVYSVGDAAHPAEVAVDDSTITANLGAGAGLEAGIDTTIALRNSIVAGQATAPDCVAVVAPASDGYNLDGDGSCNLTQGTDLPATEPILGPLSSTGSRESHALQPGSPAIDSGAGCDPLDQRHTARPQHGACDRGAVESRTTYLPFGGAQNYLGTNTQQSSQWRENTSLAISGTCVSKEQGELVMAVADWTYASTSNGSGGFQNCTPPVNGTIANVHHDPDGYTYVIEVPEGYVGTSPLVIQAQGLANCAGLSAEGTGNGSDTGSLRNDVEVTVRADDGTDGAGSGTALFGPTTLTSTTAVGGTNNYYCGATNSTSRWRTLATVPSVAAGDRFYFQIRSLPGASTTTTTGSNQFALRAYTGAAFAPCTTDPADVSSTTQCPTVYAADELGLYANIGGTNAIFRVASIEPRFGGQLLDVYLWDLGEGSSTVELLDPNGNPAVLRYEVACQDGTFTRDTGVACSGEIAPHGGYGPFNNVTSINVSGSYCANRPSTRVISCSKYNDRLLRLTVQLPENITAAYGGRTWWKVRYVAGASPTDRTTWKVAVREQG